MSAGDYIILDNLLAAAAILQGAIPGPLADDQFLDAAEIQQIREAAQRFNEIIAAQAAANGAILVDANGFLNRLAQRGLVVGGRKLTTDFLGGIFSLDGVHPSNTGAAATANYFIKTMNREAAAHIPPVNVRRIERNDPLAFPGRIPPIGRGK